MPINADGCKATNLDELKVCAENCPTRGLSRSDQPVAAGILSDELHTRPEVAPLYGELEARAPVGTNSSVVGALRYCLVRCMPKLLEVNERGTE